MGTVKSNSVAGAHFMSEGGRVESAGDGATVFGRNRVAPMVAADEMASGKASSLRNPSTGNGGSGSGDNRGLVEKGLAKANQIFSGKSGQKRSMDDDAATMARNRKKK